MNKIKKTKLRKFKYKNADNLKFRNLKNKIKMLKTQIFKNTGT